MTSPLEQKKIKITGPSVVTANRTWDGAVIYRTAQHGWSAELGDAAIVRSGDDARALLAESTADDVGAVGPYIAPVLVSESGEVEPGNLPCTHMTRSTARWSASGSPNSATR